MILLILIILLNSIIAFEITKGRKRYPERNYPKAYVIILLNMLAVIMLFVSVKIYFGFG